MSNKTSLQACKKKSIEMNKYILFISIDFFIRHYKMLVRKERLELSRLTALEPKSSASTNSATLAGVPKC